MFHYEKTKIDDRVLLYIKSVQNIFVLICILSWRIIRGIGGDSGVYCI